MFYRQDLIDHFVKFGPSWMSAKHFVDRYGLRVFVDRTREQGVLRTDEGDERP